MTDEEKKKADEAAAADAKAKADAEAAAEAAKKAVDDATKSQPTGESLEELAKSNPHVAKLLQEKQDAQDKLDQLAAAEEQRKVEEAKKQGQFSQLYDEEAAKRKKAEADAAKLSTVIGEYKETIDGLLDAVLATIPKEKQSLIPADYSSKKKLEYIMANQETLGATVVLTKGAKVPKNDNEPVLSDEMKLVGELEELFKKDNRTAIENQQLLEKSRQLKTLRASKKPAA